MQACPRRFLEIQASFDPGPARQHDPFKDGVPCSACRNLVGRTWSVVDRDSQPLPISFRVDGDSALLVGTNAVEDAGLEMPIAYDWTLAVMRTSTQG
jgi:hypothetical protein